MRLCITKYLEKHKVENKFSFVDYEEHGEM